MSDELDEVRTSHWVPTGEHKERERIAKRPHTVDQLESLRGRQLEGIPARDGVGAAVQARERTCACYFPDDDERRESEVERHARTLPRICWERVEVRRGGNISHCVWRVCGEERGGEYDGDHMFPRVVPVRWPGTLPQERWFDSGIET